MKKVFSTLLCASFILGNLACFADTTKTVGVTTDKAPLESKLLNKQYSAYSVTYVNKGLNPISINNIRGENLIGDMNKINEACRYSKLYYTLAGLGLVTFGLTMLIATPIGIYELNNMKKSTSEAVKYANAALIRAKNEIVMPQQEVKFFVLVPLNATPVMTAVFEDTKTHEYISVNN